LHEIQKAENGQIEKRGRNEIITVAKILLTSQMILLVDCDFSSIVMYTQPRRFRLNSLKFSHTNVFLLSNRRFRMILTISRPGLNSWWQLFNKIRFSYIL